MNKCLILIASMLIAVCTYGQTTNLVWAKNIKAVSTSDQGDAQEIVMDNVGNYYIAGYYRGALDMDPGPGTSTLATYGGNSDIFIAKYRNDGTFVWAKSMGTIADDAAFDLVISASQKLYVCGYFSTATSIDIDPGPSTYTLQGHQYGQASSFVASFDTSGIFQSAFSIPGSHAHALTVDNAENIYVTGDYLGTVDFDPGMGVYNKTSLVNGSYQCWNVWYAKYSSSQALQWVNVKGSTAAPAYTNMMYVEYGASIAVDNLTGNVAVGGAYANMPYTEVASASGTVLKSFSFANSGSTTGGKVLGVLYDNAGNLYYSGNYRNANDFDWSATATYTLPTNNTDAQGFVVKYDPSLNFTWATRVMPSMVSNSNLEMSFDNNQDLLLAGIDRVSSQTSVLMAKMDKNTAAILWRNNMTSSCYNGGNSNAANGIVYSPVDGSVLVTGTIGGSSVGSSVPCSFDADPGPGVYTLYAGVGNTQNVEIFMGKYGSCTGTPTGLSAISGGTLQCAGAIAVYSVSPVSGASSYTWSVPGGWTGSSTTNTISTIASSSGTITVAAVNSCGTSTVQALVVQVNPVPVQPSVISGAAALCAGGGLQTYSVPAVSGATSYSWSLPGSWSGSSTSNTIQVNPATSGGTISVLAINACGNSPSQSLVVTVNALPAISITGSSSLCSGSAATLTANGATSYTWSTASNSSSIFVSPSANATYSLSGTDGNGCMNSATKSITVNALPSVAISGLSSVCAGNTLTLSATGATSYTWNTSSNSSSISVSPSANTVYSVNGTDANGCKNSATKSITVNALPSVAIGGPSALCSASIGTLTASGASTYTWNTTSNSTNIIITPTVGTTYTLTGTDANGCVNVATKSITVYTLPFVVISGNTAICAGTNATLTATGAVSYTWDTGATTNSISVSPPSSITYSVIGIDANGCVGTAGANVAVSPVLPIIVNGPSMVCSGNSATLSATGAATYTWSTGATTGSVSVSPTAFTIYTVTGTDIAGCIGTAYKNITVVSNPTLSVTGPSTVCAGASATIQVSGALSYTWSTGAHATSQVITPFADITYYVYGTDNNGCMGGATKSITVSALPAVSISGPSAVCIGSSTTLNANGAATYTWSNGSTATGISISPTANTSYTLSGTGANSCTHTAVRSITVNPLPVVAVSGPTVICKGNTAILTASGANSYAWSTSAGTATVSVSPVSTATYTVNGTDLNGCSKAASFTLSVSPCTGIESWSREAAGISLYPNPAGHELFIQSHVPVQSYRIVDVSGRIVSEASGLAMETIKVNLQGYESGMYTILLYTGDSFRTLKFIKEY